MMAGPVLIAGGGIGGLTAALCLARAGIETVLLEQAAAFGEVGAGVQIPPNASRILHRLGLAAPLAACASQPVGIEYRHWRTGARIARWAFAGCWDAPYYQLHRADLLQVLVQAARQMPGLTLRPGARVDGFATRDDGVGLIVARQREETVGSALIGADGIHSAVRRQLLPAAESRFAGQIAWRALVPARRLPPGLAGPWTTVWWGPRRHFVHYLVRGGGLVNCVGVVARPDGSQRESWHQPGDLGTLRQDFAGWHRDLAALIDHVPPESLHVSALHHRRPLRRWGAGPATLLGDAAHPMLPFVAQGAAMAIEDAAVLAACWPAKPANAADTAPALRRYEAIRRPRTARIQRLGAYNASLFHLSGAAEWLRDRLAPVAARRTLTRIFGYDALIVAAGKPRERAPNRARQAPT